jgi:hypothetical protein
VSQVAAEMKVLLQNKLTGSFLKELNSWTDDPNEALQFKTSSSALNFSLRHCLSDIQIVLKFKNPRYDILLPNPSSP